MHIYYQLLTFDTLNILYLKIFMFNYSGNIHTGV